MRKETVYPALAPILGGLGATLRMWQRSAAYDRSGLPVPMALSSVVLALFLAVCAALFLWMASRMPKTLEDQSGVYPKGDRLALVLAMAGVGVLICGMLHLLGVFRGWQLESLATYAGSAERSEALRSFVFSNVLTLALGIAAVPTAVALLYQSKRAKNGGEANTFAALMPAFFAWIWLIEAYRQHTANPILWDYVLFLLAVVALLVSAYFRAGFSFGVGKPRRAVFTSLLAIFLAVAALPDSGGGAAALTLLALAFHAVAELLALLDGLAYRPKRLAVDVPDTKPTDSQTEEDISHE